MSESAAEDKPGRRRFPRPNARYRHVFVVVRLRRAASLTEDRPLKEDDVILTKAFSTEREAEDEAKRLNEMNSDLWRYFVSVARLAPESSGESG